jgi:tetratricopeptide (TPR) repeat protein
MLVTIPFVLLLLDAWPLQRLPLQIRNWTPLVLEKIPFFILAVASSVLTLYAQGREDAIRPLAQIPLVTRLLNALVAYTQYLNNLFWPRHLSAFHSYDFSVSVANGAWAAVLIGLICLAGLYFWKRQPYWLVGCLWFLGMLVPVIGIVQVGGQAFADRYAYLPSIGVFIVVCWTVADSVGLTASVARRSAGALFGTAVLVACLCLTRAQVMTWRDGGSAAQHAIDIELNNILARSALASYLLNNHEWDAARSQCEAALKIFPDHALTHDYLGTILYFQGHYPEAEQHLLWALRIDPALPDANFRLGDLYLAIGKPEAAQQKFKAYLSYNPEDPRANCGLGKALAMQGRHADAVWEFIAALKVGYNYPEAHRLLALSLSTLRRPSDAALEYQRALQFDPSDLDSLNNLAWLQSTSPDPTLRNGTNAIVLANRACELTTNLQPVFIGTLAAAYAEAGRFDDAIAAAQKARDLALAQTNQPIADANLKLLDLYRLHQPYREK